MAGVKKNKQRWGTCSKTRVQWDTAWPCHAIPFSPAPAPAVSVPTGRGLAVSRTAKSAVDGQAERSFRCIADVQGFVNQYQERSAFPSHSITRGSQRVYYRPQGYQKCRQGTISLPCLCSNGTRWKELNGLLEQRGHVSFHHMKIRVTGKS